MLRNPNLINLFRVTCAVGKLPSPPFKDINTCQDLLHRQAQAHPSKLFKIFLLFCSNKSQEDDIKIQNLYLQGQL